ncbi:hypothetical protein WN51_06162 [Melipona quadrifasciata]|uniref:Uncharacterized protein n=1 Tax=Melipona quadrifasciata TaxID=166423 RepID=A0A0N0BBZ6_9HYME|nr:hypothetical protein WN51_06162 [Melipona quadrifasciata]
MEMDGIKWKIERHWLTILRKNNKVKKEEMDKKENRNKEKLLELKNGERNLLFKNSRKEQKSANKQQVCPKRKVAELMFEKDAGPGTQPRLQYKRSHDVDPGDSIGRAMRQSSKTSHGPDHKHHQITPAFRPLEGKGHSESQGIKELTPMR